MANPGHGYSTSLIKEPQQHKLLAKFNETGSAERLDVYLVNGSSKLKPDSRVYEMTNNSRSLLDDPRTYYSNVVCTA